MTMWLLDSSFVIDFLQGRPDALVAYDELEPDGVGLSVMTVLEVVRGLWSRSEDEVRDVRGFLSLLGSVPIDDRIAFEIDRLDQQTRAAGRPLAHADLAILATAHVRSWSVVTEDQGLAAAARVPVRGWRTDVSEA